MKSTVSVLLASSMVLNPMNGIQIAVGSEQDQTRIDISGLINKKVEINLDSDALKTAALAAIQESNVYSVGNYLSTDTATDAAFENLMNEENPFYELQLWSSEEEAQMAENGVDVKLLVQRDSKIVKEEQEDADAPATKSQLKKSNVSFMYDARDAKSGEELAFYQPGSLLGNLLTDFQADKLYHETAEAEESVDNSAYELTGDETLTILYMNTDKEAHTFKLLVDGKTYSTGIKVSGTESLAKDILSKLKKTIKEDLTGTTEAESLTTETAAETEESTTASQDNAGASDAATTAESTETTAAAQDNAVEPTTAAAATETTTAAKDTTAAETTKEETRTAEVRQEENTAKEDASQKVSKKEAIAEAAIEEVKQLSGENTVTRIGAFTLDKFFDEAETEAVKTEEKAVEAENTADEDKTVEDSSNKEDTTEAPAEEGTTEASQDDTTAAEEETTATASTTEVDKTEESTTAVETTAEETTEAETKAITAMDESLAEARKATLQTVTAKDIAAEITSAKLVQYSLGDITSDFKSADLGAYLVKVYPVTENAIEADWKLEVKELLRDEQEAKADNAEENSTQMSEATKQALQDAGIYDNSRSLDIKLVDKDGKEVEPNGTVRVEIEMDRSLYDEADSTDLTFYHLEEEDGKITNVVQVADSSKTEALNAQGETIAKDEAVVTTTVENTETVAAVSETEEETENTASTVEVKTFSEEVAKLKTSFEVESFSTFSWVYVNTQNGNTGILDTINISLYDYKENDWLGSSVSAKERINQKILGDDLYKENNYKNYFLLNMQWNKDWGDQNSYREGNGATQGIMADEYTNKKLTINSNKVTNGIGALGGTDKHDASKLFPDSQDDVATVTVTKTGWPYDTYEESVMTAYINVDKGDNVLQQDVNNSNHYRLNGTSDIVLNTSTTSAKLNGTGNGSTGFWPFGSNQCGFGMKMSFNFGLPADGKVSGDDMVFEFSGDDDVWVYLTKQGSENEKGKLALDIGGIHGAVGGSINFRTGLITVDNAGGTTGNKKPVYWYLYSDKNVNDTVDEKTISKVVGLTRPTSGMDTYKLDFYYMERGGTNSNCYIDFTLPVVSQESVNIIKNIQGTDEDANHVFKMYSSTSEDDLKVVKDAIDAGTYNEDSKPESVTVSDNITITGANAATTEKIDVGTYFFIAEEGGKQKTRTWTLTDKAGNSLSGRTTSTDIEQMKEDGGYVLSYTNIYDDGYLEPTVAKRAWKTDEEKYDLNLEVTGSTYTVTKTAEPKDVVFVVDKSKSLSDNSLSDIKSEIAVISKKLPKGSKVACVAFSGDNIQGKGGKITGTYENKGSGHYAKVVFDWKNITGETEEQNEEVSTEIANALTSVTRGPSTHTAAGLYEAKLLLQSSEVTSDTNKKILILITDGVANAYIDENGKCHKEADERGTETEHNNAITYALEQLSAIKNVYTEEKFAAYSVLYNFSTKINDGFDPTAYSGWLSANFAQSYTATDKDKLEEALSAATGSTTYVNVKNPVVKDQLSDAVDMVLVKQRTSKDSKEYSVPQFWVVKSKVQESELSTKKNNDTQCKLYEVEMNGNELSKAVYSYGGEDKAVTYDFKDKTITWNVAASLQKDDTRTLIYSVTVNTDECTENSELSCTADKDTGTHAEQKGWKSNVKAELTYDNGSPEEFPHPVVQLREKKDGYVIVKKLLAGDAYSTEDNFTFKVTVNSTDLTGVTAATASNISSSSAEIDATKAEFTETLTGEVEGGLRSYTITMKGNQYVVVKLPKAEGCTVSVDEVKKDGTVVSVNNEADNGYKLIASKTPDDQKLGTDNLTLTYSFTNEKKVPNPTGVRTSGMAGIMAIVMGFGLMGLLSAGYVINRRKRW